ncbi:hypothetical protein RFI_28423 [Reticulomyxa filosa]|uniref:Uncharacterized protein n=1 Tax=Reticulomyxa filosa TaxID=46433 RepID=X6M676_RETFI|nr:hypothetical protein RFI_28423 [Reticulomyxa filosa]|eukprot:ETO08962.1 hypothetical protein RFI_28423 [Reticulomyxa filosa]
MYPVSIKPGKTTIDLNFHPDFQLYRGYNDSVGLHISFKQFQKKKGILRGSILFSKPNGELFTVVGVYPYQSRDYEIRPTDTWNFALVLNDLNDLSKDLTIKFSHYNFMQNTTLAPFNRTNIPVFVYGQVASVGAWDEYENAASPPPISPACIESGMCGAPQETVFVPHGSTDLRIGEFPLAYTMEKKSKRLQLRLKYLLPFFNLSKKNDEDQKQMDKN